MNFVGWSVLDPFGINAGAQDLGRTLGGGSSTPGGSSSPATVSPTASTTLNPLVYVALAASLGALGYMVLSKKKRGRR